MLEHLKNNIGQRKEKNRLKRSAKLLLGLFGCLVLVCTVYNLVLPALTAEQPTYCGNENHEHTLQCYSDPSADVEDASFWREMLPESTGNKRSDLVDIAESQLGYQESEKNYQVLEGDIVKGYTRYGEWAGDPYGNWNAYFAEFCAFYAGVNLGNEGSANYLLAEFEAKGKLLPSDDVRKKCGDLLFFEEDGETSVGIITEAGEKSVKIVAGDRDNAVSRVSFKAQDPAILAIGALKAPEALTDSKAEPRTVAKMQGGNAKKTTFLLTAPKTGPVDMTSMVTAVLLEIQKNGVWTPITNQDVINYKDEIRVAIDYTVPGGTLGEGVDTITYQIPKRIEPIEEENGEVFNTEGDVVGTYNIDIEGVITIVFHEEFVHSNSQGHAILGSVTFRGHVKTETVGDVEEVELGFTEDIVVNVKVEDDSNRVGDLKLQKNHSMLKNDQKILYTLIVTSGQGTFDQVTLKDTMIGAAYASDFAIKDKNGAPVTAIGVPQKGDETFTLTLPKMNAGDSYTITYQALLNSDKAFVGYNRVNVDNKAEATSKDNLNGPLASAASTRTPYNVLRKDGSYDKNTDLITWTITVNDDKVDISNWILTDDLGGNEEYSKATITDSKGVTTEIDFPYTFPEGSRDTYVVTYKTKPLHNTVGEQTATNTAKLYRGSERISYAVRSVVVGEFNPLTKEVAKAPRIQNASVVTDWKITVKGLEGMLGTMRVVDQVASDTSRTQYFTRGQLEEAKSTILKVMKENNITVSEWKVYLWQEPGVGKDWDTTDPKDRYSGFEYRIETKKPQNTSISYILSTSAVIPNQKITVENNVSIAGKAMAKAQAEYVPDVLMMKKQDPDNLSQKVSTHDFRTLPDGKVRWQIDLLVPKSQAHDEVTLTETLPTACDLASFRIQAKDSKEAKGLIGKDQAQETLTWQTAEGEVSVTVKKEGNVIKAILPTALHTHSDGVYRFLVDVTPNDGLSWSGKENSVIRKADLTNRVKVENSTHSVLDEQTQVLEQNDMDKIVKKAGAQGKNNVVTYTLEVNQEGRDLIEGGDTVYLTDIMEHKDNHLFYASLVPGSVKYVTADGQTVTPKYTYTEKQDDGTKGRNTYSIKFTLPDETPLTLSYQFRFAGSAAKPEYPVINRAVLEGFGEEAVPYTNTIDVALQDSGAFANIKGILIYKVDATDQGHFLKGAQFALYRFDTAQQDYVPVKNSTGGTTFVSDEKGKIALTEDTMETICYNTAYKFVETKAPEGYFKNETPYFFYIDHPDVGSYPRSIPDNFRGDRLHDGSLVYYTDEAESTGLTIVKKWLDSDGSELSDPNVNEVKVKLYRALPGEEKTLHETYTLKKSEGWSKTVTGLPLAETTADGSSGREYSYSIEEEPVPGFQVSYDHKSVYLGEVSVTNTKEAGYKLPNTGGAGIGLYLLGGLSLMVGAVLLSFRLKRRES